MRALLLSACTDCALCCIFTTSCVYVLQVECSALKGWALQQKESQIAQVQKQLLQLPEDATLADIEVRMCTTFDVRTCAHVLCSATLRMLFAVECVVQQCIRLCRHAYASRSHTVHC
jgi:hypothetical protein